MLNAKLSPEGIDFFLTQTSLSVDYFLQIYVPFFLSSMPIEVYKNTVLYEMAFSGSLFDSSLALASDGSSDDF